jgi:two-component system, sensor histidine kinase and response regulator
MFLTRGLFKGPRNQEAAAPGRYPPQPMTSLDLSSSPATPRQARILVVDDHGTTRDLLRSVLEEGGFQVQPAATGQEALAWFQDWEPDLVVLDVLMPGMDGLEVCRRLRRLERGQETPILFLTADGRRETQMGAIEAGGDDLLHKPSLHRELLIRVRSLLRIRRLQVDLRQERDRLEELQKQREMLQHFLVHDLRSQLQAVLCATELIAEAAEGPLGAQASRIQESVLTMDRMTQDLLDIAKCESGTLQAERSRFLLEATLDKWIEDLRPLFDRKEQRVRALVPAGLVMEGDPELLRRCFLNLVGNAAKYGPRGGETVVKVLLQGEDLHLRIEDQGPGIPEAMRDRIFDPFVRLARDADQARTSSGLGLAFCRAVAQVHGGRIWVEPNEPSGAVFCLELPGAISLR